MSDVNLSFSGCGFLGIYHVGVASCIKQYAPSLIQNKIAGASAGALVGCVLMCNCCLGQCTSYTLRIAARARRRALGPLHPDFELIKHLQLGLDEILPTDAHVRCTGRLFVSVTRVSDGENVLLSNFPTREHLIQALMCSTFIPLYSGMTPPTFDGVAYVDGAFSDNLPKFCNIPTITICPFAGESDICPRDTQSSHSMLLAIAPAGTPFLMTDVNINRLSKVLFPPHPVSLAKICQEGFRDALRYLSLAGYINRMPDIIQLQACVTSAKGPPISRVGGHMSCVERGGGRTSASTDDEMAPESVRRLGRRNSLESNVFQRYRRRHSSSDKPESPTVLSPVGLPTSIPSKSDSASKQRASNELHFLPPLARREFLAHLQDSQGLLYSLFHSQAYRICSILASPVYLPAEVTMRIIRRVSRYSVSCVKSIFNNTVGGVYRMLDYFYSTAVMYSPIVITSQPDGRLICSLDVVADRLNGQSAEHIFQNNRTRLMQERKEDQPDITKVFSRQNSQTEAPASPNNSRPQHLVHLHLNSAAEDPYKMRRLAHGRVDSQAATDCLDTLLQRTASVDELFHEESDDHREDYQSDHRESFGSKMRRSNTTDDASTIERLVGGRGKPSNVPVLSYYYPDPLTDQLLVWELKELDTGSP